MDSSVATITQNGILTAVAEGTTTIMASIEVGGESYMTTCNVEVTRVIP